jgi:hypothetical protein
MLVVAPSAALAHLLVAWMPARLELGRLSHTISRQTQHLDAEWKQCAELRARIEKLQQVAATRSEARPSWLPRRDRHGVFDRLAEAFQDERVSVERLTLDEPALYAAVSRSNLLACEQITVCCSGDYAPLASCLDRVISLDLPVRLAQLSWSRAGMRLSLSLLLEVPFVPDETLRRALAEAAGLSEESNGP